MAAVVALAVTFLVAFGAGKSMADVGELGAPPADAEVIGTLVDLYNRGQPPDYTVDVKLVGPVVVGQPTEHPNPPPQPWCVRCGRPEQGASPMYPVVAMVLVTTTQGLESSALPASSVVHTTTVTYNGKPCPSQTVAQYCPAYFFYRDGAGNWQVA